MMAYFGSNYYEAEPGIYLPTPYGGGYDFAPSHHALAPYSCYEFNEPSFFQYGPNPFVDAYDPAPNRSTISYSVSTVSQSELVVYDPTPYGGGYDPFHTQFTVSYNKSGFNEPDFEEYDPTPYGGGYDIAQTYGKPLPPSDEICYPRDAPQAIAPSLDPLPSGKKEEDHESASEPQKGSQPSKASEEEQEQQSHGGTEDVLNRGYENGHGSNLGEPLGSSQSGEIEGNYYDDYYPWTGYEYDYGNGRSDKHEMRSKCLKIHGDTAQKQWTFVRVFLVIGPACTSRKGTDIKEPRMKKETATSGRELKILSLEVHILTPIKG
ncbi:hypothetical protein CK203_079389 [Vitis vinifera]|uniref:Uncharacterized protein n=1 Tax=Vitis vinifera TaxID=29760 RepID=A0A438BSD3_VITVI|nr:hypothetical protein CK203_079389 [Vitis vinifera]